MQLDCKRFFVTLRHRFEYFVKKKTYIAIWAVSVFAILVTLIVPHHHHNGVGCLVMEQCEADNTYNDEHTAHHEEHNGDVACVRNFHSLQAKPYGMDEGLPQLPCSFVASVFNGSLPEVYFAEEIPYDGYVSSYLSAIVSRAVPLRAPPVL